MLIKGGLVLDPANALQGRYDLRLKAGKIAALGPELSAEPGEEVLDAQGLIVAPGFVDIHVHFRDPGLTHKETLSSGSRAAAAGGFTSVVCMANTKPVMDEPDEVRAFYERAAREAVVNVYTVASVTRSLAGEELTDFAALKAAGVVGFSDDGNPIPTAKLMRQALETARHVGLPVIAHEGDLSLVADTIVNAGAAAARLGLGGMPAAAEDIQVARDVLLAGLTGGHVHIQHVSSARSVAIIRAAKVRGMPVTAEATPHHFTLTDEALLTWGADAKMNPPLRSAADVAAVRQGLADGTLDAIATDHAPHAPAEKATGLAQAPCGIIGLETALGLTWTELVQAGILTPAQAIAKLTYLPARIVGLAKGTLSPGADADIAIFDPAATWEVDPAEFYSQSRNTPFTGRKLTGRIVYTLVAGHVVCAGGKVLSEEA